MLDIAFGCRRISADIQNRILPMRICDNTLAFAKEGDARRVKVYDPDDELFEDGWMNGHDVYRDEEDGGIWYDGYYCADATDYEEAEMEYWNTH